MRIIFVTQHLTDGGAQREIAAFANALAHIGEDVCIAYTKDLGIDYPVDPKVRTFYLSHDSKVRIPKFRGLCNTFLVWKQLRMLSGDVVIAVNLSRDRIWWIWVFTLFEKTGMVYAVINNVEKKCPEKKTRKQYERACHMADAVWIQTEKQRRFLPARTQQKAFIVRNILDEKFLDISKTYSGEICHFISVGRLQPQKNQELLVEAFAEMLKRTGNNKATLTIYGKAEAGSQETEEKIRALIRKYHLEKQVFLPGWVKDIEIKYARADAFVFGSNYEGFPNALMEAMASGLPCISTDCPTGPSELINSGENGILVPVGDVNAMSRAMELMIRQPRRAEQMGKQARKTMQGWESSRELAKQLLAQLRRICR